MRLIITRHGETFWNRKHLMQGTIDSELSPTGLYEAEKLAKRLKNDHFDYIYSSPLSRAKLTAEEVARFHPDVTFGVVEDLIERDFGEFEGKTKKDIGWHTSPHPEPPEGELSSDNVSRAGQFMSYLLKIHKKSDVVLLVAHKHINSAIIASCLGTDWDSVYDMSEWKNTNVTIIQVDKTGDGEVVLLDDAKHL
ncbi:histidine phosphatase family protein [Candidatus Peregrinibacteria bacterium]|nr:histidine phosphatase family protein [Candidatus Peregrinibacteria bacterium]